MIPPNTRSGGDTAQGGEKQPKLRSTCDACITAKIRCSRDTPQCFRCQIYKINCVYSLSRKMGRPRKQRTPPQSEQDNQPRAVDRSSASREDTKPAKRSVKGHAKRSSVTKELSSGASIPSPMSQESTAAAANVIPVPGAVDASSLILDGSLSSYADYSLGGMGPTNQGELPQITQSPTIADYSLDTSFTTLLQATTLENPPNLPSSVPLNTAATVAPSGSQSPAWNYGMNPNVFNLDQDPSLFNNFVDLEPVDFSVSSSSGHSPDMDPRMSVDSMMPETDLPYLINTAETTPSNGSNTPYTFSSRCNCYKSTLHLLLSLDDIAPTTASITLDTALRVDSEVLTHNEKVLKCTVCGGKHSTQLLLQAILLDRVLGLLEIGMLEATSTRNAASQSFSNLKGPSDTANNPSNLSNLMRFGGSGTSQHENMVAAGLAEFEIAEVKNSFTKQLVKMHLLNMVSGLENLQKATQSVTPDSSARMAETMLAELGVRLVNVIGRVELWNI